MHTNIINKHFSKSDKIQDFHMIVDDDPVVVDESIKFSFNNVNNEVVLVNNTSTLSTDTCIYINDLSNESEISNDGLSNIVSNTTATNITCTRGYNVVNCIESNINKNVTCNSEKYSKEIYVLSDYLDVVETENRNFDIIYNFYYETCNRNVLSKRQVWMSIFHIINFKKKNHGHRGPGFFLLKN